MLQFQQQQAAQNTQLASQQQQQSNQQAAQNQMQLEQMKAQLESQKNSDLSKGKKEEILLQGFTTMWAAGIAVPSELKQVEAEIIKNIALPLFAENTKNGIA